MDRGEIVELLTELGRRLDGRRVQGEMYVVGGAAVALAFDARRSTRDIDAVFEPKRTLANERGLPVGWLNDGVKSFLAGPDEDATSVLEVRGLRVSTATCSSRGRAAESAPETS